jgi:thiamine biosynthesis protein ThiS
MRGGGPTGGSTPLTDRSVERPRPASEILLTLNGEPYALPSGATILDLVARLGRDPRTVAVERNGDLVPRAQYGEVALAGGDRLEVVHFVQGG